MPGDLGAHLDAQLRVEVRERLVHEEGRGSRTIARPMRDPLPLATREVARALRAASARPRIRAALDAALDLGLRHPAIFNTEAPCCRRRSCAGRARSSGTPSRCRGPSAGDRSRRGRRSGRAGGDLLEPGDHPERGRLAAAGRADEDHELAVGDLEVELAQPASRRRRPSSAGRARWRPRPGTLLGSPPSVRSTHAEDHLESARTWG